MSAVDDLTSIRRASNFPLQRTGDLLRTVSPGIKRVAVLWNPPQPAHEGLLKALETGAASLGLELQPLAVRTADDLDGALVAAKRERAGGLTMLGSVIHFQNLRRIADLAKQSKLPAVSWTREFVAFGGLMSYGVNQVGQYRRAAYFVDKILKGAAPATLPVEQPTSFELVINAKTATASASRSPARCYCGRIKSLSSPCISARR